MNIGCHLSIRQGFTKAAMIAKTLNANAFQYFPKNPRSLSVKSWNAPDAQACADYCHQQGIVSIAHSPYPTNLASEDLQLREATIISLRNDLEIAEACGSIGVVVHFGKYKGVDPLQGYKNIIQCLHAVLVDWKGKAKLLIENQAGEGTLMGTMLEELVQIRSLSEHREHIGFCFDTCHAYACGLWPSHKEGWTQLEAKGNLLGYFDHVQAIHLNDSLYAGGMKKDRHAPIGQGTIGEARFREFLQSPALQGIPIFLETPKDEHGSHAQEVEYVRKLAKTAKNRL
ncbi:deoxyribonuclease IV [Paenibacillus agricola]|uniref:Deoxyribonuclease IV n=1 Tax=Paenibacillus agricola TaxID=2716264 RepID=A0ABX0J6D1_9BACL|nr:deoxyribonuclease IV [Paenibacillus agricola]NHN30724.1 deoxyribonuclease IV [Paenibacillus agricola]